MCSLFLKSNHLPQSVLLEHKKPLFVILSSLLLLSQFFLATASGGNLVSETKNISITAASTNNPLRAGVSENAYFYQVTNNSLQDFTILALNYLPQQAKPLMPTSDEVKNVNKSAIACRFDSPGNGLKNAQSCVVKLNFDTSNLTKGDSIKMAQAAIAGHANTEPRPYRDYFPADVTVEPTPGNLHFQADGLVGQKWTLSDDGREYTLTVTNNSKNPISEIDDVAIDLNVWNSTDLDEFRAYFGKTAPKASPGCTLVTTSSDDCKFVFKRIGEPLSALNSQLKANVFFSSHNLLKSAPLTVTVVKQTPEPGIMNFVAEDLTKDMWSLTDNDNVRVLTVINSSPNPNDELQDVNINVADWNDKSLAELRAYFGALLPEPSPGCAIVKPNSPQTAACTFTFKRSGTPLIYLDSPLRGVIPFSSRNAIKKALTVTVKMGLEVTLHANLTPNSLVTGRTAVVYYTVSNHSDVDYQILTLTDLPAAMQETDLTPAESERYGGNGTQCALNISNATKPALPSGQSCVIKFNVTHAVYSESFYVQADNNESASKAPPLTIIEVQAEDASLNTFKVASTICVSDEATKDVKVVFPVTNLNPTTLINHLQVNPNAKLLEDYKISIALDPVSCEAVANDKPCLITVTRQQYKPMLGLATLGLADPSLLPVEIFGANTKKITVQVGVWYFSDQAKPCEVMPTR